MATKFAQGIQPSNSTDALFRIWIKFVLASLTNGGWVQTADTGQINTATVTKPGGANTAQGYAILRMDDALAVAYPVFLRLDFGSSGGANNPGVWITLGAGSDGAGTITPVWYSSPTSGTPTLTTLSTSTTEPTIYCTGSADTNRAQVAMFVVPSTTNFGLFFSIERTKDSGGGDTGDGAILQFSAGGNLRWGNFLYALPTQQPAGQDGFSFVLSTQSPSVLSQDVGMSPIYPVAELVRQPGTGFVIGRDGDWLDTARIRVLFYGEFITYQRLFDTRATNVSSAIDSTTAVFIRFD